MTDSAVPAPFLHTLYSDHHGWLLGWLRRRLQCADSAADLTQDTFVRILQKREPQVPREPRAYLTTIARGLLINLRERQALERAYLDMLATLPEPQAPSPESRWLIFEALLQIDLMLRGLPPKVRSAFLLSQLEGCSYAEIAQRLDVSTSSVKQYLSRATAHCLRSEFLD